MIRVGLQQPPFSDAANALGRRAADRDGGERQRMRRLPVLWSTPATPGFNPFGFKTPGFNTPSFKTSGFKTPSFNNPLFDTAWHVAQPDRPEFSERNLPADLKRPRSVQPGVAAEPMLKAATPAPGLPPNWRPTQGLSMQGLSMQGLSMQRLSMHGLSMQGLSMQGLSIQSIESLKNNNPTGASTASGHRHPTAEANH